MITTLVLFCFLFTQVMGGIFLYAKPARAQWVVTDPVTGAQMTVKNFWDYVKLSFAMAGTQALVNAVSQFIQKIAYETAVWASTGFKGQRPLLFTSQWKKYLEDAGYAAAGEFIGSLSEMAGIDFCAPPNPEVQLSIQIGLQERMKPPPPKCDFKQIMQQWDTFISEFKSGEVLKRMKVAFEPGQSDLSLALDLSGKMFDQKAKEELAKTKTREEGQGWKDVEDVISGNIKTPPSVIKRTVEVSFTEAGQRVEQIKWEISGQTLAQGGIQILLIALSTFVNTLASKTLQRLASGIWSVKDIYDYFKGSEAVYSPEFASVGGRQATEVAYADFLTPTIKEGGAYDILIEFANCPEKFRGINNCVIDGMFEAAVRQSQSGEPLTVREAINKGFLHGEWPLISERDSAKNQDPYCFQKGYCYSNLVKLRKARIIPIGWEIAANSEANDGTITLKKIVDSFNDCNQNGEADIDHPWCHLIDPDWILKAPLHQCRAKVYGPLLQTSESNLRQEICVDTPSCIEEDSNYNCVGGWGYCVREKNVWRLNADSCDAQYDSCRTLSSRTGQVNSYLLNTVDYDGCDAEQAGCRWYSTWQSKVGNDWQWEDRASAGVKTDRIYFNKNVEQCDAADEGCREFIKTTKETSLNLLQNSSFESFTGTADDADADVFDGWEWRGNVSDGKAYSEAYSGTASIGPVGGGAHTNSANQIIETNKPLAGRTFILTLYAKNSGTPKCEGSSRLFAETGASSSSDHESFSNDLAYDDWDGTTWKRFTHQYTFPSDENTTKLGVSIYPEAFCLIDAVQLEERLDATAYHEGWANTGESIYLKKAPEYYNCYNYNPDGTVKTSDDADACTNFAGACMESEAGCEKYTPVTGDPWVPGIAEYPSDYCPAECVGYQTFAQEATNFEPAKFPVYFIPQTGKTCPSVEAGCDQFTNLETEAIENFSYLRRCQLPGADEATYYTWEGSDTAGYQLKTWSLKGGGATTVGSDPDGGTPPCTKLAADGTTCDTTDTTTGFCAKADMATNPDCREFYDTEGKRHYRLYSKTIVSTDDCHPYRKTISTQDDCQASGGNWDATRSECVYMAYPPESVSCSAVGCRAYRGNTGANVMNVFWDDFEADITNDWQGNISVSTEALESGGHSGKIEAGQTGQRKVGDLVRKNGIYLISFWAKAGGTGGSAEIKFSSDTGLPLSTNLSLTWQPYTLGPIEMTWDPTVDDPATTQTVESETLNLKAIGAQAFFDNVMLREVVDRIYLIKDSWKTPASCDMTAFGGYLPQAMLGCQEYRDRAGRQHFLKSFTNLCRPEAIGCEKLIDTHNSVSPYGEVYNLEEPDIVEDTVSVPADSFDFLIVDQTKTCNPANKGCSAFGAPALDADGAATGFETVYLKNDPARYTGQGAILCQAPYAGCEEFTDTRGTKFYFKDPGARTCEWKERVSYQGEDRTGWFKKDAQGNDEPCYPNYASGGIFGIWKNADLNYARWVGKCPPTQNFCTKFIDPARTSGENPEGEPYYYIKNTRLEDLAGECRGQVSLKNGCVLFNDTSDLNVYYSSGATYAASNNKAGDPGGLVNAVDCKQNPTSEFCKRCLEIVISTGDGIEEIHWGNFCTKNEDCSSNYGLGCRVLNDYYPLSPIGNEPVYDDLTGTIFRYNDSNLILKVGRDRVCGEWLTCQTSTTTWDSMNNKYKEICDAVGLCNQYQKAGQATTCANFVSRPAQILDLKTYSSRDISWRGMDYSGYSLYNKFPIEKISQINVAGANQETDWRLAFVEPTKCYSATGERDCGTDPPGTCDGANDTACGTGKCWNHKCAYDIEGNIVGNISEVKPFEVGEAESPSCRAYPESDSPFPQTIGVTKRQPGFARANICEEGDNKCECSYQKVEYKNAGVTKYYSVAATDIPEGICQGGPNDGGPCKDRSECGSPEEGGACAIKSKTSEVLGWQGYCLEKDKSRNINASQDEYPCMTWLPVDQLAGISDIYNQYQEAGFVSNPENGVYGKFYCLNAQGNGNGEIRDGKPNYTYSINEQLTTAQGCSGLWCSWGRCNPFCDNIKGEITKGDILQLPNQISSTLSLKDIAKITFTVEYRDAEDMPKGASFDLWLDGTGGLASWTKGINMSVVPGRVVTGRYLNRPNEFFLFYGSGNYVNENGEICMDPSAPCYYDEELESFLSVGDLRKESAPDFFNSGKMRCNDNDPAKGGNWHAIHLTFRDEGQFPIKYKMYYCDRSGGTGGIVYNLKLTLKEWCPNIADTGHENIAWTDRLWKEGRYSHPLTYSYSTEYAPFGSLGFLNLPQKQVVLYQPELCTANLGDDPYCKYDDISSNAISSYGAPFGCLHEKCVRSFEENGGVGAEIHSPSSYDADENLGRLFAKADVYEYGNDGSYHSTQSFIVNSTEQGDDVKSPTPPVVAAVGTCQGGKCSPGQTGTISVGNKSSGDIISRTGSLSTSIKFFAWADPDQMPIKSVVVDFDNGTIKNPGTENFYKNHHGYTPAGNSACDSRDFGHSPDACDEEPFSFQTTYTCTDSSSRGWTDSCPDTTVSGGCCVFVPKVQVKDNWGWCNGSCPGAPGGDGCYDASQQRPVAGTNECDMNMAAILGVAPWTEFAGRIIVVPR